MNVRQLKTFCSRFDAVSSGPKMRKLRRSALAFSTSRRKAPMTAVANQLDDEPQDDPAEEPMSAADFQGIARAHELCDHPAAREFSPSSLGNSELSNRTHVSLLPHATKILHAQIRAGELLAEMKQRGELSDLGVTCRLVELGDDETDEVELVPDWAQIAQDAWHEGWARAAKEYQFARMRR